MGFYVHHTPGRLRVKIPTLQHKPYRCNTLRNHFATWEGIQDIQIRPLTGSLTVQYDPDLISPERILDLLKAQYGFDENLSIDNDEIIRNSATRATQAVGRALFGWGVGRALEANGLSLLASLI
jgi:hypothetical protein